MMINMYMYVYSDPPNAGLSVARQIAMISYRTPYGYESKFSRRKDATSGSWEVKSYLEYQVIIYNLPYHTIP